MTPADRDPPLHGVAIYNPDLLSRDELKRYFVGRQPLLERILADLRRERPGAIPQHRLILGQRGMGKTSLLRRIAIAVDEDPELSQQWLPLTFPEEQYNIGDLADLWLNSLDAIGDALERAGQEALADALDQRIEALTDADAATLLQALLERARRLDRRLLLLLDNADLILKRLKREEWALREALQAHPELLVFAASAGAIEASYRYDAPFYDFFRIDELKGLTEAELRQTLIQLAQLHGTPAVTELVNRDPARIRTLHTLTGGNPRTTVLLYGVLAQGPAGDHRGDIRSDLEGLLDRVTPLYKARFEELPEQAQRLVDALALHWDPASARQLADRLGWEVNLVSAQLKRLQDQGVVEKTAPFEGKRALFQIGERFFNIWYLMRASRRVRRRLTWLVQFLRIFYTPDELRQRARHQLEIQNRRGEEGQRQAEYSLALAQTLDDAPLRSALETHGLRGLVDDGESRRRLGELLDLRGEDAPLADRAERLQILAEARERLAAALDGADVDCDRERLLLYLLGSPDLSLVEKQQTAQEARRFGRQRWQALDHTLAEGYSRLERAFGVDPTSLYRAIAEGDMADGKDVAGAGAAEARLRDTNLPAIAWLLRWKIEPEEAESAVAALERSQLDTAKAWFFRGYQLHIRLSRHEEAEQTYRRAIEIDPDYARPWNNLGWLLHKNLGRYEEAEQAYRRAIEIDPAFAYPWSNLGILLTNHLGRYEEAEEAYRRAIEIDPDYALAWNNLGLLLKNHLGRYEEAEQAYRRAIEIDPAFAWPWNNLAVFIYERAGDLHKALEHAEIAHSLAPDNLNILHTLATLQVRIGDWPTAAPLIRRLVAEADETWLEAIWDEVLRLFQEAVAAGRAAEARDLLDASEAGERWRPLREALAAAAAGSVDYLRQVAPEVAAPARELYARLITPPESLAEPAHSSARSITASVRVSS